MMPEAGWIERFFGRGVQRDGQAHALEELATDIDFVETPAPPDEPSAPRALAGEPRAIVLESLATKILNAHLQNRHQTLFPLTMNFQSLRPAETTLLVEAMAAAMLADGGLTETEAEEVATSLRTIGAGDAERERLEASLREPRALNAIIADVQAANLSALAYAASVLGVDRRQEVNQLYLDYLAARLALPSEVVVSLNRRYMR